MFTTDTRRSLLTIVIYSMRVVLDVRACVDLCRQCGCHVLPLLTDEVDSSAKAWWITLIADRKHVLDEKGLGIIMVGVWDLLGRRGRNELVSV